MQTVKEENPPNNAYLALRGDEKSPSQKIDENRFLELYLEVRAIQSLAGGRKQ